jgi:adenosylcobinamide-phosphate synthase
VTPALESLAPALVLVLAWLLDCTLGEPPARLHPVVWMGWLVRPLTRLWPRAPAVELFTGGLYAVSVVLLCAAAGLALRWLPAVVRWPLEVYLLWSCFALRGLVLAGSEMARALAGGDLARSRAALTSLCSRDPAELSPEELAGATIESLSENASDSVVAPLFYFALGGLPLVLAYRAANTLDAMVGYHGRFEYLGKLAARLDDLLNLVPARLTALLLALAATALGLPVRRGLAVWRRDARRTESPNAGHPMAMAAGLLGVRLDKREAYVLGHDLAPAGLPTLEGALALVRRAGWLAALACFMVLAVRGAFGEGL